MKSANMISWVPGYERREHFLKRTISENSCGWRFGLNERDVRCVLDKSDVGQAKSAVTPGSKEAMSTAEHAEKK